MVKTLTRSKAKKAVKAKKPMKKGSIKLKSKKILRSLRSGQVSKAKKIKMVKKVTKKVTKKLVKKVTMKAKKAVQSKAKSPVIAGQIGKVVHYYDKIGVAIVELTGVVTVGDLLTFKRGEREFTQPVSSMQIDHQPVEKAGKGKVIGVKVVQVADPGTIVLPG